jgi:ATP-dependent DNA helicase RecQ
VVSATTALKPKEKFVAQDEVVLAIKAVVQTDQRFGAPHLVDVLRGQENQYVVSYNHNKLEVYGKGAGQEEAYWNSLYRQILVFDYLDKDVDNYGV